MLFRNLRSIGVGVMLAGAALWALAQQPQPLPTLKIDRDAVSVSGLSSGGYMAVQMHVAHSRTFRRGVAVVAGGPYFCAEASISNALGRCMAHDEPIPVDELAATTRAFAAQGVIDDPAALRDSRVYLFSGTQDTTVKPAVVRDLYDYYRQFVPADRIVFRRDVPAGHAMVTDGTGGRCSVTDPPFINDCEVDLAGDLLKALHGPLQPRRDGALGGRFIEFDQQPFDAGQGLADTGWLYVPAACTADGPACALHVVFHGCRQNTATIGTQYVRDTGYNRWADTNRIVLLYPQTGRLATNGCWDWWGYESDDYAVKAGAQVAAVRAMVARLSGEAPPPFTPGRCLTSTNAGHVAAGRARIVWGVARAKGSEESLGWWYWSTTTLRQTRRDHYEKVDRASCG